MSLGFPSGKLRPRSGSIRALLFENERAGVARDVFWSVEVEFEPIDHRSQRYQCNAQVEWMQLGLRDWRALEGRSVRSDREAFEASFYALEHDGSNDTQLHLHDRQHASFLLDLRMSIDFSGTTEDDAEPSMPVSAQLRVPFEGLMIASDLVAPDPGNEAKVLEVAGQFVDLGSFGNPALRTNEFGFTAWWLPP